MPGPRATRSSGEQKKKKMENKQTPRTDAIHM